MAPLGSQQLVLVSLSRFYTTGDHMDRVRPYIVGPPPVSLRLIDWFVTNYARRHNTVLLRRDALNNVVHFNVHLSYRAQLKSVSKQMFDPFRRRDRISFFTGVDADDMVVTTIGQLNFFRWMLENSVLDYVVEHADAIAAEMLLPGAATGTDADADVTADADADSARDAADPTLPPTKPQRAAAAAPAPAPAPAPVHVPEPVKPQRGRRTSPNHPAQPVCIQRLRTTVTFQ